MTLLGSCYQICKKYTNVDVQQKTPDDGQRKFPKYVEFFDKIKFGKFVCFLGFIKKKFVTMHCHMNVKSQRKSSRSSQKYLLLHSSARSSCSGVLRYAPSTPPPPPHLQCECRGYGSRVCSLHGKCSKGFYFSTEKMLQFILVFYSCLSSEYT